MGEKKRYQVFVSSTFTDLEVERGKVMETILKYDCFPAGMEMFPAMDEEIFEYIKRIIDDSDYYLLIIGGRYGSVDKSNGKSWTEQEYDYAVSKGIPVIAFDHRDFTKLPDNKTDKGKKRRQLVAFKKKVNEARMIDFWSNADELATAVATSLKVTIERYPGKGWVRAGYGDSVDLQIDKDSLQKEITEHENIINKLEMALQKKNGKDVRDSSHQDTYNIIKNLREQLKNLKEQNNNLREQSKNLKEQVNNLKVQEKNLETEFGELNSSTATIEKPHVLSEIFTVNNVSFKMIHVGGGTFMMGANKGDKDAYPDEKPAHKVTLSDYWMGETQVTQALWEAVMGENPSEFDDDPNLPVENVSWEDCKVFINKLNKITGKVFHLPSEAQWEFAARGGNFGKRNRYLYAGSYDVYNIAWFEDNSSEMTHPVGERNPNELGLYDMSGNVWEWCNDWYDNNYSNSPLLNPIGSEMGTHNVVRGGSWCDNAAGCRVSCRLINRPNFMGNNLGLRLAL